MSEDRKIASKIMDIISKEIQLDESIKDVKQIITIDGVNFLPDELEERYDSFMSFDKIKLHDILIIKDTIEEKKVIYDYQSLLKEIKKFRRDNTLIIVGMHSNRIIDEIIKKEKMEIKNIKIILKPNYDFQMFRKKKLPNFKYSSNDGVINLFYVDTILVSEQKTAFFYAESNNVHSIRFAEGSKTKDNFSLT